MIILSPPKREEKKRKPSDFVLSLSDKTNAHNTRKESHQILFYPNWIKQTCITRGQGLSNLDKPSGKVYQIMINLRQNDTDMSDNDISEAHRHFVN